MRSIPVLTAVLMVAIVAAITFALRAAPFLLFGGKRQTPRTVTYLGRFLPPAIIGALVVYCLKNAAYVPFDFSNFPLVLPALIAGAVTAILHIFFKNTLFSILAGTVTYMVLIRVVPVFMM